jgi:hypothetical protein
MTDSVTDRLRGLLASDVYSERGRLRADDLLVRQRVDHALGAAAERLRELSARWRTDRVPPSTRQNPFPPAEVMEPLRRADRMVLALQEAATAVRGLPLLSPDKVWDRVRGVGLAELAQFDWAMVCEAERLAAEIAEVHSLDMVASPLVDAHLERLRQVVADRRHYLEYQG